jgi:hypothetical protein
MFLSHHYFGLMMHVFQNVFTTDLPGATIFRQTKATRLHAYQDVLAARTPVWAHYKQQIPRL